MKVDILIDQLDLGEKSKLEKHTWKTLYDDSGVASHEDGLNGMFSGIWALMYTLPH